MNSAHCSRCVCVCVCVCAHCSKCVCACVCVPTAPGVCALGWVKCREHISLLVGMHRNDNSWPKPNKMKHWPILPFLSLLHKLNSQNQLITLLSCFTKKNNNNNLTLNIFIHPIRHYTNKAQFKIKSNHFYCHITTAQVPW